MVQVTVMHNIKPKVFAILVVLFAIVGFKSYNQPTRQVMPDHPDRNFRVPVKEEYFDRLSKSLQFPTVSYDDLDLIDYSVIEEFYRFLEESFPLVFKNTDQIHVGKYSIIFKWLCHKRHTAKKPILLMAHIDVVPPGEGWKHPPFSGAKVGDEIWGRGALDDKHCVMAILESIEYSIERGFKPGRDIYFSFGIDEEIGGVNGAKKVAEYFEDKGISFEFVSDEGYPFIEGQIPGLKGPVAIVGTSEKGYLHLEMKLKTLGGHSSLPPRSTAIGRMSRAIASLENRPFPSHLTACRTVFETLAPEMPWAQRILMSNLWLFNPLIKYMMSLKQDTDALLRTTISVSVIKGGTKINVLPSEVTALVNLRIAPYDTTEGAYQRVRSIVKAVDGDIDVTIKDRLEPSPSSDTTSETYSQFVKVIKSIYPDYYVAPGMLIANTDTRYYWKLSEQIYRFVPIVVSRESIATIHGANERISKNNYMNLINFYCQLIIQMGG